MAWEAIQIASYFFPSSFCLYYLKFLCFSEQSMKINSNHQLKISPELEQFVAKLMVSYLRKLLFHHDNMVVHYHSIL